MNSQHEEPRIERVMHEVQRRPLQVLDSQHLSPGMVRITLGGETLAGFRSAAPDDHVKLVFTTPDGATEMRDYTPRRHDPDAGTLLIDFVIHAAGIASDWAAAARPGDTLVVAGPRGSRVISGDIREWLFIGDETALPAIGRFLEELPAGTRATVLASVPTDADILPLSSEAEVDLRWLPRNGRDATDVEPWLEALAQITTGGRCFAWVAAETSVARTLRRALIDQRQHSPRWMKVAGYWTQGSGNSSSKDIED